jgi:hypothetical protein
LEVAECSTNNPSKEDTNDISKRLSPVTTNLRKRQRLVNPEEMESIEKLVETECCGGAFYRDIHLLSLPIVKKKKGDVKETVAYFKVGGKSERFPEESSSSRKKGKKMKRI